MQMRAVPDDFDNIRALHSPYGAVPGRPTPAQSPGGYRPSLNDHLIRPLTLDTTRRYENESLNSSTSFGSEYHHGGFQASRPTNNQDLLSPLSLDSQFPSLLSSPVSGGPQSPDSLSRRNSVHTRQQLKPLQIRDTVSRARSQSIQSPLRISMSWKGETLDYNSYQREQSSHFNGRPQARYESSMHGDTMFDVRQDEGGGYTSEFPIRLRQQFSNMINYDLMAGRLSNLHLTHPTNTTILASTPSPTHTPPLLNNPAPPPN